MPELRTSSPVHPGGNCRAASGNVSKWVAVCVCRGQLHRSAPSAPTLIAQTNVAAGRRQTMSGLPALHAAAPTGPREAVLRGQRGRVTAAGPRGTKRAGSGRAAPRGVTHRGRNFPTNHGQTAAELGKARGGAERLCFGETAPPVLHLGTETK